MFGPDVWAHHRSDPPLPSPDAAYSGNLAQIKASIVEAADEVVHVAQPLAGDVWPYLTAFMLLMFAVEYLFRQIGRQAGMEPDATSTGILDAMNDDPYAGRHAARGRHQA